MANLNCQPAIDVTTHSATVRGTADQIPANHFLRVAYGVTSGGPFNTFASSIPGDATFGQQYSDTIDNLLPTQQYYYVLQELDTDGITILAESDQCTFTTLDYNTTCQIVGFTETTITVQVCADYVAPEQTLDFIWGTTQGGPYPNNGGSVPGTDTLNQCATFTLEDLDPCTVIYYRGSVTNVPAIYEVDWAYSHAPTPNTIFPQLTGQPQTTELRIGPEQDYPANQTLVDTDTVILPADSGVWNRKTGTYPVPLNITQLHMGFVSTDPQNPQNGGNMLDRCSIILRRVLPSPLVIGEQLVNGSFEFPVVGGPGFTMVSELTPGIAWQTTAPDGLIEYWPDSNVAYASLQPDDGDQYAELNGNFVSEFFQVVNLDVATADSTECTASTFNLDCVPATNIDCVSATLNGTYCGLPDHYFYQFQYATSLGGPFFNVGPAQLVVPFSTVDVPISVGSGPLDPNTTYFYRIAAYNNQLEVIGTSETCSFTTLNCVSWCGGWFDPDTCLPVDFDADGNPDYLNCNQV